MEKKSLYYATEYMSCDFFMYSVSRSTHTISYDFPIRKEGKAKKNRIGSSFCGNMSPKYGINTGRICRVLCKI